MSDKYVVMMDENTRKLIASIKMLDELGLPVSPEQKEIVSSACEQYVHDNLIPALSQLVSDKLQGFPIDLDLNIRYDKTGTINVLSSILKGDIKKEKKREIREKKPHHEPHFHKRPPFKFSLVNIKVGEIVVFQPTHLEVKVYSDDQVEYNGNVYSLSTFVREYIPENQKCSSEKYRGPLYFTYKGELLTDMRNRIESKKGNNNI